MYLTIILFYIHLSVYISRLFSIPLPITYYRLSPTQRSSLYYLSTYLSKYLSIYLSIYVGGHHLWALPGALLDLLRGHPDREGGHQDAHPEGRLNKSWGRRGQERKMGSIKINHFFPKYLGSFSKEFMVQLQTFITSDYMYIKE